MGRELAFAALLLAPGLSRAQAPAAAAQSACANTPAYSPCELVFELKDQDAAAHPNPYITVDLKVEFRSPRQRTYALPAFWDGGRRMVVRFAPTEGGEWNYHVTSNIPAWNDQTGTFTTAASEAPGFLRAENVHHWAYTERNANGLDQPHLWMGATERRFAFLDDAAFQAVADARAAQRFTHLRGLISGDAADQPLFQAPDVPNLALFQRLDRRVRYLNQKGMVADLVLARGPGDLEKYLSGWDARRRFVRFLAARFSAMNVTWELVEQFENYPTGRAQLTEMGAALKEADPYQHPRTAGARITSAPLLDDKWMAFVAHGSSDSNVSAIEHQLFGVPFVGSFGREDSGAGKSGPDDVDAATFRHRLWNATMDGQYVTYANTGSGPQYVNSPGAKGMTAWFDFFSGTRYWELEPYFDVDNGRAVALEDSEYVVYVEKPGPLELIVEKHSYDVSWINPIDGEAIRSKKKFSGDHFTGEPPDRSHDWVLHLEREGHLASMAKSVKFDSRDEGIVLQEIEANSSKVPFAIEQPTGDLSLSKSVTYSAKMTRETRATRSMFWLWTGNVAADGQGFRVLATGQKTTLPLPADLAINYPAVMHLRLYGMNANGKVYELDTGCGLDK